MSLFETVKLSVTISPGNLYNSLKSIKEIIFCNCDILPSDILVLALGCVSKPVSEKQVYLQENYLVQTTGGQNLEIRFQSKYYKESRLILLKSVLIVSSNLEIIWF